MAETIPECPGRARERNPFPEDRRCPNCGQMVEIWSNEQRKTCVCGTIVWMEQIPSCAEWCKEAEKCFGVKPEA